MFTFYWPYMSVLALLPILVWWLLPMRKPAEASLPEIRFPNTERLIQAFPSYRMPPKKSENWLLLALSLMWICLTLAVMRPQKVDQFAYIENQGYDLMLAVDISGSMKALDFSTQQVIKNRLDVIKEVVSDFVHGRQGDRIGLILFGEHAYLQVPLTLDTVAVSHMLNNSVSGMAGDSTSIGDAIGLAVLNLRDRPEGSRVIILLTDGEDTASSIPPIEAAKIAKQYGIRIYTIGVGKSGAVPYPDGNGGVVTAEMSMDEALLKNIAQITDGAYFRASSELELQDVYKKIDGLEKTKAESREYLIREPLYRYPLIMAGLLMLIIGLVPLYRRFSHGV